MAYDPAASWMILRTHLDSLGILKVAEGLGLDRKIEAGKELPAVCPRWECRSYSIHRYDDLLTCFGCGMTGGGAALFAAKVAGWTHDQMVDAEPESIAADFVNLAKEAMFSGFMDRAPREVIDFYIGIPDFEKWTPGTRGIFEGPTRAMRLRGFAGELLRTNMPGQSVIRACWAWSGAFCKPALAMSEVVEIVGAEAAKGARP